MPFGRGVGTSAGRGLRLLKSGDKNGFGVKREPQTEVEGTDKILSGTVFLSGEEKCPPRVDNDVLFQWEGGRDGGCSTMGLAATKKRRELPNMFNGGKKLCRVAIPKCERGETKQLCPHEGISAIWGVIRGGEGESGNYKLNRGCNGRTFVKRS